MSLMDAMDDALLGADDDELDYDLEKDEEDALLADDNYEETYDEAQNEEHQEEQYEEPIQNEEESDILDIDINVGLDETEEDFGDQSVKDTPNNTRVSIQMENDDDDEVEEQKERNRFSSERTNTVQRQNSQVIPDSLEKVAVQVAPHHKNNNRNHRGNRGRGRGRQNNYRGPVFNRIGIPPPLESKTVLINPHFRGNVQVSENTRLVWDLNSQNQRYQGPQMAQVAPFQSQPFPWINPPYETQNNNFNHQQRQPNYPEPVQQMQYNQPPEMGIRPLMQVNNQPPPFVAQQPPQQQPMTNWCEDQTYETMYPPQGNFRGRDAQFNNQPAIPPLMMNNPPPNFNQQGRNNFNFPEQNIPNQNRPFINPNHHNQVPIIQMQPNFPPPQHQNFDQPPQHFVPQNHNQNRPVQPPYEPYNEHNQFQYPPPVHNNQIFQGQNFQQQPVNYDPNFIPNPNQPAPQESFPPKQFNHQFNQTRPNQRPMNQFHRTPPKRRSFENNGGSGDRDLSKKKKRSMEFSNLHEVPTVDMPDTTTEEKEEEEDEETKLLRLQIEEQKKLREKLLREKEERRKMAAAQKAANLANTPAPPGNLIATIKTANIQQIVKQQQFAKQPIPQNQQWRQQQPQQQQIQNQISRQRIQVQQRNQIQNNPQRSQNIQVTNTGHVFQRRKIQPPNQQANIVVMQKQQPTQQQLQRVVMVKETATNNRRVVLKGMNAVSESNISGQNSQQSPEGNLSSFLSNRKVISNTGSETSAVGLNQPAMLDTPIVVVSNLAAGTTDVKIRKLCQGLGPVQNVQMNSNQRSATIRFKNIISAHKFFKKFQRKMIDLSMIQVTLEPES